MDVKSVNTVDTALNDVFKLLGVESCSREFFDDVSANRPESRGELYRWLVALALGANFRESRTFKTSIVRDYLDLIADDVDPDLKTRTNCSLVESINAYVYLVLERYEYSRLDRITLDENQDARELFLSVAFLVCKDEWFQFSDRMSEEFRSLKDLILEFSSKDFELLNISKDDLEGVKEDLSNQPKPDASISKDPKTNRDRFFADYLRAGVKVEDNEYVDELIEKKEQFEHSIIQLASDISSKATLLSRRKTVRSYDSELLRLIMGRSSYENDFLKSIDDVWSNETDMSKEVLDRGAYAEAFSEDVGDVEEWDALVKDIAKLSNVIVTQQFKIRDLSTSIEKHDLERLKYFSKITNEFKNYEKKNKATGDDAFISDRYKQPSPVEFLLISDEMLFKRHMGIMRVINKSLDNEIRRTEFWKFASQILADVEGKEPLEEQEEEPGDAPVEERNNNLLAIYSKPSDIKYNVHVLKSFLVEGIPNENFSVRASTGSSPYYKSSLDFLRQVNVKFANFKAGQVSDKHGRKTTFSMFTIKEIERAKRAGLYSEEEHDRVNESLKRFFHLFEDVRPDRVRIELPLMSKWIDGTENFDSIARVKGPKLSESLVNSISDSKTAEYELLERDNFRVIDNSVNGVFEPLRPAPKPPALSGTISDILNYHYYFDLCRRNYEKTREAEINCFGFSNQLEKLLNRVHDSTAKNADLSRAGLERISELIRKDTDLHLVV